MLDCSAHCGPWWKVEMVEQRKAGKSKYQQGLMGRSHHSKSQPGGITLTLGGVVSGYEKMSTPQVTFP